MTSKERALLRSIGSGIESTCQIGKGEITDCIFKDLHAQLEKRELVKVSVLRTSPVSAEESAKILASAVKAETVAVTGNKILLYRRSKDEKVNHLLQAQD